MADTLIVTGPEDLSSALRAAGRTGSRVLLTGGAAEALPPAQAGVRLYVPPELAEQFPEAHVAVLCPLTGQPVFSLLRRHHLRFGARAAAVFRPGALLAELRPGQPAQLRAARPDTIGGDVRCSPACLCAFTLTRREGEITAVLFDTEKTLARRCALARRLGVECIVLPDEPA